jgi:hypothetical protein
LRYGKRSPNLENQLGNHVDGEKDVQDGISNVQSWLVISLGKEWIFIQEVWISCSHITTMNLLSRRYVLLFSVETDDRHIMDVVNGLITSYIPVISILRD